MLDKSTTSIDDDALNYTCPVCRQMPGQWCVYVGRRMRAGYETARLHAQRMQQVWIDRQDPTAATTKPHPALRTLREFDRREERALRVWLRQYAHLLLRLDSTAR